MPWKIVRTIYIWEMYCLCTNRLVFIFLFVCRATLFRSYFIYLSHSRVCRFSVDVLLRIIFRGLNVVCVVVGALGIGCGFSPSVSLSLFLLNFSIISFLRSVRNFSYSPYSADKSFFFSFASTMKLFDTRIGRDYTTKYSWNTLAGDGV